MDEDSTCIQQVCGNYMQMQQMQMQMQMPDSGGCGGWLAGLLLFLRCAGCTAPINCVQDLGAAPGTAVSGFFGYMVGE